RKNPLAPAPEPLVTGRSEQDFSALFRTPPAAQEPTPPLHEFDESGGTPTSFEEPSYSQTPHEEPEPIAPAPPPVDEYAESPAHAPEPVAEFTVTPAEVIEPRPRKKRGGVDSATEVQDLLRTFAPEPPAGHSPAPVQAERAPVASQPESGIVRALGISAVIAGVAAIGLSVLPGFSRFAIPVASAGILSALGAIVVAVRRQAGGLPVPIGGSVLSALGIASALLVGYGVIPIGRPRPFAHAGQTPPVLIPSTTAPAADTQPAEGYVPATSPLIVNNVEVRIASARLLHPAVYTGTYSSLHTLDERRMQITLEFKALGGEQVIYQPWRKTETGEDAKLTDSLGNVLDLDLSPSKPSIPAMAPVGGLLGPTIFGPRDRPTTDVLLFKPPDGVTGSFKLDLPGANLGVSNTTLHILIPKEMVQVQPS
ncbi:MAG TPA: hypothetical protein VLJ39_03220, partial [Tepidisphaeraceae bacterium]|nr:hypothetical protein [Tepidisphaeraceae bacterium]